MDSLKPTFPEISEKDRTPLVDILLEIVAWQSDRVEKLEQEVLKLKGETTKPDIKPSKMDKGDSDDGDNKSPTKRGPRRKKTENLRIDSVIEVQPEKVSEGSEFKGYHEVVIQDIILKSFNTCYRLAQYQMADGNYVSGQLPRSLKGCHFGATLISFVRYQYHNQHVTQPLLLDYLQELGIDISAGQVNKFITEDLEPFHQEKEELLRVGLEVSEYIQTDDTGARHQGKSGYCTHIGNEFFAWFSSTESKSRINFLELLSQGVERCYVINDGALAYMESHKLPKVLLVKLDSINVEKNQAKEWSLWLDDQGIKGKTHRRIITEGALIGGLLAQGIPADFGIISDDAGQFNVFDHALCWIHAERVINRLIPLNKLHEVAVDWARGEVWGIYADLKAYKLAPTAEQSEAIKQRLQDLCRKKTTYSTLNQALKRMGANQHELLRVLDKPYLPLHNNLSERDIRDYVKKRKISGSTRSEAGRRARDTFASLKKTCRKHGISFWDYLNDRLLNEEKIPRLSELIRDAATCG